MSNRSLLAHGGLLIVGLLMVTGCDTGGAIAQQEKFDTSVLDAYMSDNDVVYSTSASFKSSKAKTKHTKKSSSKSWPDNFDYDTKPIDYDSFVGEWSAKLEMTSTDENVSPEMAEMGKAMADMFGEMLSMSLSLNKGKSFRMTVMMMPIEGNWRQRGNSLYLTPEKIMGYTEDEIKKLSEEMASSFDGSDGLTIEMTRDKFEPLEFRIAERGKVLIALNTHSDDDQPLVFRRK